MKTGNFIWQQSYNSLGYVSEYINAIWFKNIYYAKFL